MTRCVTLFDRARQLGDSGHYKEAIAKLTEAIALRPQDEILYQFRSFYYMRMGSYEKGIEDANKCIALDPESVAAYENRAAAYERLGRFDLARKDREAVRRINEHPSDSFVRKAVGFMVERKYSQAMRLFDRAVATDPKYPVAYLERGRALMELEHPDKAALDFEKAVKLGDQDIAFDGLFEVAGAYLALDKPVKAVDAMTRVLKIDPNSYDAHFARAQAYAASGQYQKAIDDTRECEASMDSIRSQAQRMAVHARRLKVTKNGKPKIPDDPLAMMAGDFEFLADCFNHLKQYDKAVAEYTKAIAVNPKNDEAYIARARDYIELRKYDKAVDDCTTVIRLNPKDEEAYKLRGDALCLSKQFEKAIPDFSKAIDLDPQNCWRALGARADAYDKLGKRDLAEKDRLKAKSMGFPQKGK